MKNVMTRAWEIAREGAANFGGKVKEYFAEALRMAWAETKKGANDLPKVVKLHAEKILKSGDQPAMQYAMSRAEIDFGILVRSVKKITAYKKSIGEPAGTIEDFKKLLENASLDQYINIMLQLNHMAKHLPKV